MSFTTPLYGLFFCIVLIFFLGFQFLKFENKSKFLRFYFLFFSYIFYAAWDYVSLILIIITSLTDFFSSKLIYFEENPSKKRLYLIISLVVNLGMLLLFKYYAFIVRNLSSFLLFFGLNVEWLPMLELVLPIGISFYTFQSLSYTIDVYRGEIQPEKNLSTYLLYIAFFPQLVAGPIVPAKILLPQLEYFLVNERLGLKGVYLISIGLVKKLLIADRLAMLVDTFYANPADYSWAAALISVFAYSIQIFCDFSGYTDIARGSALLFGITLPENFQAPYLSLSFSEFWRRWHITLSTWLKNYLYISLGGNRKGKFRTSINLLLTMLLGGLWHGASWNFLTWGLLHGLLLVLEKSFSTSYFLSNPVISTVGKFKRLAFLTIFLRWMMVFLFVTLLWIPFRSPNFETTLIVLKKIFIYSGGLNFPKSLENEFFLIISIILVAHFFYLKGFDGEIYILKFPKWILVFLFVILLHMVVILSKDSKPFIYFVF